MHDVTYLRSARLLAKVALPGRGIHAQHRFDYTGFVPEVVVDGKHVIGAPEQYWTDRWTSYGAGFCNGFNWAAPADEAGSGGSFFQIGVGKLTQRDGRSGFNIRYPYDVEPGQFAWEMDGDSAMRFTFSAPTVGGYGATLEKTLALDDSSMTICTELVNTGDKPITGCREYNHNFLAINARPFDGRYALSLPMVQGFPELPSGVSVNNKVLTLDAPRTEPFFFLCDDVRRSPGPCWELSHAEAPVTVAEDAADFAPADIAVWGIEHVMSPEVFIEINALPGERIVWTRKWRFSCR